MFLYFLTREQQSDAYRTCSTKLVLLRIVVGTLESFRGLEEEYGCVCSWAAKFSRHVSFVRATGRSRPH
jgi:hypothetical protein